MEKYIYVFIILLFAVIIPVAIYLELKPVLRHNKLSNGAVNYDTFMKKYVFRVELTKEEFYAQLKTHNINDSLEYFLSDDYSVITFTRYNSRYEYKIMIDEFDEYIILRVKQVSLVSRVAYLINEFFIRKFNAKPLEYKKYTF